MDPLQIPDDLSGITDEQLTELYEEIVELGSKLGEAAEITDEQVETLEGLAEALDTVKVEQERRAGVAAERAERRSAAIAKLQKNDDEDDLDDEPEAEAEADDIEIVSEDEVEIVEDEPALVASKGTAGLAKRRPAATAPRETAARSEFMSASGHAIGVPEGHRFETSLEVAEAITRKRMQMGVVPDGTREYLSIATGAKQIPNAIGSDAVENFSVLRNLQGNMSSLVASGGYIAPLTPLYDFFRLAEPQTPVEDALPVVQAPRGGIRFISPPAHTVANSAVDGPFASDHNYDSNPKTCYQLTSPSVVEREVEAVSQCITFDNLAYRVFPEQVQAFLEDVAVAFATKKETVYLDYIDSSSTAVTADYGYGLSRSLLQDWTVAAVAYRKRNGMPRNAPVQIMSPDWALDAIKLDMALDAQNGLNMWEISDAQVAAALAARGISWIGYNDTATGGTQKFNGAQSAGALNAWPTSVVAYVNAPGTFVRLDGGTLDVGLVRDSALNRTNDVEMFMEEWIGIAMLGLESVKLTSTVCLNGAAPNGVTAATC